MDDDYTPPRMFLLAPTVQRTKDYARTHFEELCGFQVIVITEVRHLFGVYLRPEDRYVWLNPTPEVARAWEWLEITGERGW